MSCSTDTDFVKNIEGLKQTIKDAKRLKKELAAQISELDARFKKSKADHFWGKKAKS